MDSPTDSWVVCSKTEQQRTPHSIHTVLKYACKLFTVNSLTAKSLSPAVVAPGLLLGWRTRNSSISRGLTMVFATGDGKTGSLHGKAVWG